MTRAVGPRTRTVTSSCYKLARNTSSVKQPNFLSIEEKKTAKDKQKDKNRSESRLRKLRRESILVFGKGKKDKNISKAEISPP